MKIITFIIAVLISNTCFAKQKYYKWTDENGSIHYSTDKPENNETEEIKISTNQPVVSHKPVEQQSHQEEHQPKAPEEQSYLEQRNEKKQKARELVAKNKSQCQKAKQTLTKYQQQVRMSSIDKVSGEKVYLEDSKRAEIIKQANNAVQKYCK